MGENEDMSADDISALLAASMASRSDPPELSPEDAAWVDSCLAPDAPLPPDSQWSEIGEALVEAIAICIDEEPPSYQETPRVDPELSVKEELIEPIKPDEDPELPVEEEPVEPEEDVDELVKRLKDTYIGSEADIESHGNRYATSKEADEDDELMGSVRIGPQEAIESRDSIFKVWDLEMVADEEDDKEENELVKQFKKALAKTDAGPRAAEQHDIAVDKELVAGIEDLSL